MPARENARRERGLMTWFPATFFLLVWCSTSEATNLGGEYFLYPHVNFSYWSNYCRRSDMTMLYYTGLMEALDAYVARR